MPSSVLIVDDEPGMRELLKRWLTGEEYVALEARTAEDALTVAGTNPDIKVAIVDLQMPGRGGAWLVEQLQLFLPGTSVVLATANDTVPGALSLRSNVVGYIVKPLTQDKVLQLVADGLRRSSQYSDVAPDAPDPIESFLDRKLTRGSYTDDK